MTCSFTPRSRACLSIGVHNITVTCCISWLLGVRHREIGPRAYKPFMEISRVSLSAFFELFMASEWYPYRNTLQYPLREPETLRLIIMVFGASGLFICQEYYGLGLMVWAQLRNPKLSKQKALSPSTRLRTELQESTQHGWALKTLKSAILGLRLWGCRVLLGRRHRV